MPLKAGWYIRVWVDFTGSVEILPLLIVGKPFKDNGEYVYTAKVAGHTCYYLDKDLADCNTPNLHRRLYPFSNKLLDKLKNIKGSIKMIERLTGRKVQKPEMLLNHWNKFRSILKDT